MAAWQFDLHLIPASAVERRFGTVPQTLSADDYDATLWWEGTDVGNDVVSDLAPLLPKAQAWRAGLETWGHEVSDRVDVMLEGSGVAEIFVRIDVRRLSRPFLTGLVATADRRGLLIVTEERQLLRPSIEHLLQAIKHSRAAEFVVDPAGLFSRLPEGNATSSRGRVTD